MLGRVHGCESLSQLSSTDRIAGCNESVRSNLDEFTDRHDKDEKGVWDQNSGVNPAHSVAHGDHVQPLPAQSNLPARFWLRVFEWKSQPGFNKDN